MDELFGTDGIRGPFGVQNITPQFFLKLGFAIGEFLGHSKKVLIGSDTRRSGQVLQLSLSSGLLASGIDVCFLGALSTPAVSFLTEKTKSDLGIMITASHNPSSDNGVKFFNAQGYKIDTKMQKSIEEIMSKGREFSSQRVGSYSINIGLQKIYRDFLESLYPHFSCSQLKIALDCSHGGLSNLAPELFLRLGAKIAVIGDQPTGENINQDVGVLHPEKITKLVEKTDSDIGFSFDGDGDRLAVFYKGKIIAPEHVLLFLYDFFSQSKDYRGGLATTILANAGVDIYLKSKNISFLKTSVGDRYLAQALQENQWTIAGEPSGHYLLFHHTKSSDALLVALIIIIGINEFQMGFEKYQKECQLHSQEMMNVPCMNKYAILENANFQDSLDTLKKQNPFVDILVRPSGTEPKIRISAQSALADNLTPVLQNIADLIKKISDLEAA